MGAVCPYEKSVNSCFIKRRHTQEEKRNVMVTAVIL